MKFRDPETGEFKELYTKAADTLPVGAVVDYEGTEVPAGWEIIDENPLMKIVEYEVTNVTIKTNEIIYKVIPTTVPEGYSLLGYFQMGNGYLSRLIVTIIRAVNSECVVSMANLGSTDITNGTAYIRALYVRKDCI